VCQLQALLGNRSEMVELRVVFKGCGR